MWVRWLATVRSPRNSAAATSRFVRPSATRAATRRSAAVSPSSRVRPPMLPSSSRAFSAQVAAPSCSKPSSAASIASRAARFCRARLRTMPSASSARALAERIADVLVLRDRLLQEGGGLIDAPLGGGDETAASRHVREHPLAADPRRVRLPGVEDAHRVVDPAELEEQLDVVGAPPADARLAPPERRGLPVGLAEPLRGRGRVSAPERDEPQDRHVLRRVERELLFGQLEGSFRVLAGELELAAMDGDRARWEGGPAAPRARTGSRCRGRCAACAAASAQRPAQNSTQARPQSARALRGSSRSRHSRCSRSSRARASSLLEDGARVFTTASVASCTSCSPPTALAKSCARAGRSSGASASPTNQPRMACTARARARSTSSSSSSASSSAARACSNPFLKRVAHARRQWIDRLKRRARGRLAQGFLEQRDAHDRRSRARRGGRAPRRAASRFPSRPAGRSRSLGRASTRRRRDAHELRRALGDGARRARPAASAGAPARRARPRRPTRRDRPPASRRRRARAATSASGASLESAR